MIPLDRIIRVDVKITLNSYVEKRNCCQLVVTTEKMTVMVDECAGRVDVQRSSQTCANYSNISLFLA